MTRARPIPDRFRITGLLLAVAGICVHQLLAPSCGSTGPWIALGGVFIALAGLAVIAVGVRRRIARAEIQTGETSTHLLPSP